MRLPIMVFVSCCLVIAGCTRTTHPAPVVTPDALRERLGAAGCIVAKLTATVTPQQGDGEIFSMVVWITDDGRIRLLAHKTGHDFLSALVAADRSYTAFAPRTRLVTRGKLDGNSDPLLLRDLGLLVAEAREGPVPTAAAVTVAADGRWQFRDPATGWDREIELDLVSGLPSHKVLFGPERRAQRRIDYFQWRGYDGLHRAERVHLAVAGDATEYAFRVKSIDVVPMINQQAMHLQIPPDAIEVASDEFERRLGE